MSEADLPLQAERHLDDVCDRFEAAWKSGRPPRIEDFLGELLPAAALLRELVLLDVFHRHRQGESPTPEDYLSRFGALDRDWLARACQVARTPAQTLLPSDSSLAALGIRPVSQADAAVAPASGDTEMRIMLTVAAGPNKGQEFAFTGHDTFIVGRSPRAHFQLPGKDRFFSRIHFMVEVNPPRCRVLDMGSRNGTHVNGKRIKTADLQDADQIKAGRTIFRVNLQEAPSPILSREELPGRNPPVPASLVDVCLVPRTPARGSREHPKTSNLRFPSDQGRIHCLVCDAGVSPQTTAARGLTGRSVVPLCAECRDTIRAVPQPIDGYLIVRELGRGSMGVVYLAVCVAERSLVALKVIVPAGPVTKVQVKRFLREANILRELDHPHIVAFRGMGESNGQLFFAMDYVRGTDGARLLARHGPLPVSRAVELVCQVLKGLEYAHARQFVHRDIKPANLLVTDVAGSEGRQQVVKLADFGLARVYQSSRISGLTMTGTPGGTVAFMAPEQITHFREARPPADQYSAAATLYNLLTDHYIYDFSGRVELQLGLILQQDPVPIRERQPDLPAELAGVIHRALARGPEDRFADARQFRLALSPFAR
jgi:serine/threonine-protein kinase